MSLVPEPADGRIGEALGLLHEKLRLSRTTLRIDLPIEPRMPMTHELLSPGTSSLAGRVVAAGGSPTVRRLLESRSAVIVEDTARLPALDPHFDDAGYKAMVADYELTAMIVAPIFDGDHLAGILSLQAVDGPRAWSSDEIAFVESTVARIRDDVIAAGDGAGDLRQP